MAVVVQWWNNGFQAAGTGSIPVYRSTILLANKCLDTGNARFCEIAWQHASIPLLGDLNIHRNCFIRKP
ncbi:MAG: hypothetical protein OXD29_14495 [Roseovarius sp.]|nr:hypothetical protein [Roseovarius sp.]MCY4209138.1 hypothetical protein [Roseovarius sp.]MCY4290586.1 hypothetical protein [Roseovarius sp.]MCY4317464.1 hypothetical protein [Roseovarius sp.]